MQDPRNASRLCRVFPLGRIYEEDRIRYFLQMDACQKPGRSKVKVGKWLDTPQMERYERFLLDWHAIRKQLEKPDERRNW